MESSSSSLPIMKSPLMALSSSLTTTTTTITLLCLLLFAGSGLFPLGCSASDALITYHNGPLLSGNVSLALLWYGEFNPVEKTVLRTFIESLSVDRSLSFQPDVYSWWQKVESYVEEAAAANKKNEKSPRVSVRIAKEVVDEDASAGKVLDSRSLPGLLQKATAGLGNTVAVIFTAKDVIVQDTCSSPCYLKGVEGKQLYIVVGNPEEQCPGDCAVPFHSSSMPGWPRAVITLDPPSGNTGADAMVIHFASALAETVTNPFNTGFYGEYLEPYDYQAARACTGLFATGAFPGYPGNIRVDPMTGGAFNAHGLNHSTFLLPALWDPKTNYCWTIL